jgi:hypothetical protein
MNICLLQVVSVMLKIFNPEISEERETDIGTYQLRFDSEVAVDFESLEEVADLSSSAVETILSIMELAPFSFLAVSNIRFDTIIGRIQSVSGQQTSSPDRVVAAIIQLNDTQLDSKKEADREDGNGIGWLRDGQNICYF